jgi:hypothetical protein
VCDARCREHVRQKRRQLARVEAGVDGGELLLEPSPAGKGFRRPVDAVEEVHGGYLIHPEGLNQRHKVSGGGTADGPDHKAARSGDGQ